MQERRRSHGTASPSSWLSVSSLSAQNPPHLSVEGERVKYTGPGTSDKDAASVRANQAVPFGVGLYYFEIEVIDKGRNGYVGVGLSAPTVPLNRLPGWEPASYGYHGDDGHVFYESGRGRIYGPTFGKGDVVGVLLNRADRTISFTRNGVNLGIAFRNVNEDTLYPTVGMRTPDEEIVANFGSRPFVADYKKLQSEIRSSVYQSLESEEVSSWLRSQPSCHPPTLQSVVMGFLIDNGHWKTAQAAARDSTGSFEELTEKQIERSLQEIQLRRDVRTAITKGSCQEAVTRINSAKPSLLHKQAALGFKLQCMVFMQMVESGNVDEAIVFGKKILMPQADTETNRKLLADALTLLTVENVKECPNYVPLLGPAARQRLSNEVNAELLRSQGLPGQSLLEASFRQSELLRKELHVQGSASAAMLDFDEYVDLKSKSN